MRKIFFKASGLFLLFGIMLILGACSVPVSVPVQSIMFQNDGTGFIEFYTNDSSRLGYTYYEPDIAGAAAPMTSIEVQMKKISGVSSMGYGFVFCYTDINNFYALVTTVNGVYRVNRRVGGVTSTIQDWTTSANLSTGFNTLNTLKVTYNGGNSFTVFLNGVSTITYSDSSFTSGRYGFLAPISTSESFPNTPVNIKWKMLQPVIVP